MTLIQATTSTIYNSVDRVSALTIAAHYSIDLKKLEYAIVPLYNADNQAHYESIQKQLTDILTKTDLSRIYLNSPSKELSNCIIYINALDQLTLFRVR